MIVGLFVSFPRIPELPPVVEGSEALFQPDTFPIYEHATPQAVVSGGLRVCSETDAAIQHHVEKSARGNEDLFIEIVLSD